MDYAALLVILVPAVFLIVLRRLIHGVYLLIIVLPFLGMFTMERFGVHLKMSDLVALVCLSVFVPDFLLRPRRNFFSRPLVKPLIVFALLNLVSALSKYPEVMHLSGEGGLNSPALISIKVTFWCIYSILIAIMVSDAIVDKIILRNCVLIFLGITMLICIYSLIGLAGHWLGIKAMTWRLVGRPGGFLGLRGTFDEPSYFSHYMSLAVPLALMVFILRIYRLGFFVPTLACFILFITNFFILSTAGMVGSVIFVLLTPYFIRRFGLLTAREAVRLFVIAFIIVCIIYIGGVMAKVDPVFIIKVNIEKLFNPREPRTAGTMLAFNIFRESPLIGVGPGNWRWYYQQRIPEPIRLRAFAPSFNNCYLEILLDVGLLGFIVFGWIFMSLFRRLGRAVRKTKDRFLQAVLTGFIVGFITLLIEYYACFNFYRIYIWVPLGLAMAAIRIADEEEESEAGAG